MNPDVRRQYFDTPLLKYTGSKWALAEWIISMFPPHAVYVEPFAGGASVFFRKHRSSLEVLNDLDGELVNFFRVLRSRRDELLEQIQLTPWAQEEYGLALQPAPEDDHLERARRFYVGVWQSFGGTIIYRSGFRRQKTDKGWASITDNWRRMDGLMDAADRLKDAVLDHRPAVDVIRYYDQPNALFYVDPPYVLSSRSQGGRKRYRFEMVDSDHRELAEVLHTVKGHVILSGYASELYTELYGDWKQLEKSSTTNGNYQSTEVLWLSPRAARIEALPLFAE